MSEVSLGMEDMALCYQRACFVQFFLNNHTPFIDGELQSACFVECFFVFHFRSGVSDDARADVIMELLVFADESADGDIELAFVVVAEIAHRPTVEAARHGFELVDDFTSTFFGGPGDAAAGKAGGEQVDGIDIGSEFSAHGRYEVKDLFEGFELQHFIDAHGTKLANLADVIAEQVGDHDELRNFLRGSLQLIGGASVLIGIGKAGSSAFDGASFDMPSAESKKRLGRRAENFAMAESHPCGHGSGGAIAEAFIESAERAGGRARSEELLGEIDLIDVASGNPFADAFDALQEMSACHLRFESADVAGRLFGRGLHAAGHITDFRPVIGLVVINEHVGVVSEDKRAIIIDGAAEPTTGEPGIETGALVFEPSAAKSELIRTAVEVSLQYIFGLGGDQRNGRARIARSVPGRIKKNKALLLAKMLRHLPRREVSPGIGQSMG